MLREKIIYSFGQDQKLENFYSKVLEGAGVYYKNFRHYDHFWDSVKEQTPDLVIFNLISPSKDQVDKLMLMKTILDQVDTQMLVGFNFNNLNLEAFLKRKNIHFSKTTELIQRNLYMKLNQIFYDQKSNPDNFAYRPLAESVCLNINSQIIKMGELTCKIKSPVKFSTLNFNINVSSEPLSDLDISFSKLKVNSVSNFIDRRNYLTDFSFLGLSEKSAQKIRSEKNKWREKV